MPAIRTETADGVRSIILARPEAYNTITPELRDELAAAIDAADDDPDVRVMLLRAEGRAFCAGYALDLEAYAAEDPDALATLTTMQRADGRLWDSVADYRQMKRYVDTYMKLWYAHKPTIAAVSGWAVGGGTDMVLCCDLIVASERATFGYPPSRVWGTPTTAMWVYRLGLEKAKRYMLTGDAIPAVEAERIGLILQTFSHDRFEEDAMALARRMARVPVNQLIMNKLLANQTAENMGLGSSRMMGTLFDGIARHTQEGLAFAARMAEVGHRQAVRERDEPFGDYGSKPREP